MQTRTLSGVAVLAAAFALIATGCSVKAPPAETATETTTVPAATEAAPAPAETEATTDPTTEPTTDTTTDPATGADGLTAPGSTIGIDDVATVDWYSYEKGTQKLDIWIDSIEPGKQSDFKNLSKDFRDKVAEYDVWYITIKAQKSGKSTLKLQYQALYPDISGIDTDGNRLQKITVIGNFKPCKLDSFPAGIDKGKVASTCVTVGTKPGQEVGGALFSKGSGVYSIYDGLGITWKK